MLSMGARSTEHPLLKTLVVCGASLVSLGCGGQTAAELNASRGGSAAGGAGGHAGAGGQGGGTSVLCPEHCSSRAQYVCDDLSARTNCRCDAARPIEADDCESTWDFSCQSGVAAPGCAQFIAFSPSFACECLPERLHPEDCDHTAQFTCTAYEPVAQNCQCVPNAPTQPEQCPAGSQYLCHSSDPDVGCQCAVITLIK